MPRRCCTKRLKAGGPLSPPDVSRPRQPSCNKVRKTHRHASAGKQCTSLKRLVALSWPAFLKFPNLLTKRVEVIRRQPRLITRSQVLPVLVGHGEPGGVAVGALHHHVLAKHALGTKTKANGRAL